MLYEIIIDSGETPNKCTIAPLSNRVDFSLFRVKGNHRFGPLKAPLLLHHEGICLTKIKGTVPVSGIASIDCIWRRLNTIIQRIEAPLPTFARIPDGFETAYPRRTKNNSDPITGLATIEAIFVAAAILGNWDVTLLSQYYFGKKFVELNKQRFLDLGVYQAADPEALPILSQRSRSSMQRRQDRGRF